MSTFLISLYVVPVVVIWAFFLGDKFRGIETEAQGGDSDLISMLFNVGSFIPVVNIVIMIQLLSIVWKHVKTKYFRDEFY